MEERYYIDDDTGAVVKLNKKHNIEVFRVNAKKWEVLPPDSSYMREIFLGQGNNCLSKIDKETAERIIKGKR